MKEIVISFMYVFRQFAKFFSKENFATLAGNLDPFYGFSILYALKERRKKRIIEFFVVVAVLALYALLQIVILDEVNITKMVVNILKIVVCYMVFRYAYDHAKDFSIIKMIIITIVMFATLTILSLVFNQSEFFWRFNDSYNDFTKTRLQLFYLEPSELGYHLLLVMLPLGGVFILGKKRGVKIASAVLIMTCVIILYMAKPMGAIAIGGLAVVGMIMYDFMLRPSKKKVIAYAVLFIVGIIVLGILIYMDNPLIMRVITALQGKDSSSTYRSQLSMNVLFNSLKDYNFIGCGFGNQNTARFIESYSHLGMVQVVVNSFVYIIIETGVFGIVVVAGIIIGLLTKSFRDKSIIKMSLSLFIIVYSFLGGHFTSAVTWVAYGIICSDIKDEDIVSQFENIYESMHTLIGARAKRKEV